MEVIRGGENLKQKVTVMVKTHLPWGVVMNTTFKTVEQPANNNAANNNAANNNAASNNNGAGNRLPNECIPRMS